MIHLEHAEPVFGQNECGMIGLRSEGPLADAGNAVCENARRRVRSRRFE